jgi:hypothetical protein
MYLERTKIARAAGGAATQAEAHRALKRCTNLE